MIREIFDRYGVSAECPIVIACSGGSDSMYLLHLTMQEISHDRIVVAHYHHGIRAAGADRDESFVRDFSIRHGLRFECERGDIPKKSREEKIGIEEAARLARYAFLSSVSEKCGARFILTAHHLDDSIETFVFNLLRGTKLGGLVGVEERNGRILRPLLKMRKSEILSECSSRNIPFIEDETNEDDSLLRNHIRHNIVPQFHRVNPSFHSNLSDLMEYFSRLKTHLDIRSETILREGNSFRIADFEALDDFEKKEFVAYIYRLCNGGTIGLSKGNIDEIIRFVGDRGNGTVKKIRNLNLKKKSGIIRLL